MLMGIHMPGVMPASSLYRIRPANSTGIWLIQKKIFPVLCKRRIALINALRVQLSAGWACFLAFPGGLWYHSENICGFEEAFS
ncbi:MAG: hypothetical protein MR018_09220 [Clostridiales bacterium]|nr:hypothetical protein [Clostridiales bacterium]